MLHTPLFVSKKEFFLTLVVFVCIASISLSIEFYHFKKLTQSSIYTAKATVLNHYTKTNEKGKSYDVFKLRLDDGGVEVYTTLWHQTSIPLKSRVKVKLKVDKVMFYDYLKGFYAPSTALYEIYEDDPPLDVKPLYRWIDNQHENEKIAELYKTLLFATPISKELRDKVQKWGISVIAHPKNLF